MQFLRNLTDIYLVEGALNGQYLQYGVLNPARALLYAINNWDLLPPKGDLVSTSSDNLTILLKPDSPCGITIQSIDQFFILTSDEAPTEAYEFYQDEDGWGVECGFLTRRMIEAAAYMDTPDYINKLRSIADDFHHQFHNKISSEIYPVLYVKKDERCNDSSEHDYFPVSHIDHVRQVFEYRTWKDIRSESLDDDTVFWIRDREEKAAGSSIDAQMMVFVDHDLDTGIVRTKWAPNSPKGTPLITFLTSEVINTTDKHY